MISRRGAQTEQLQSQQPSLHQECLLPTRGRLLGQLIKRCNLHNPQEEGYRTVGTFVINFITGINGVMDTVDESSDNVTLEIINRPGNSRGHGNYFFLDLGSPSSSLHKTLQRWWTSSWTGMCRPSFSFVDVAIEAHFFLPPPLDLHPLRFMISISNDDGLPFLARQSSRVSEH